MTADHSCDDCMQDIIYSTQSQTSTAVYCECGGAECRERAIPIGDVFVQTSSLGDEPNLSARYIPDHALQCLAARWSEFHRWMPYRLSARKRRVEDSDDIVQGSSGNVTKKAKTVESKAKCQPTEDSKASVWPECKTTMQGVLPARESIEGGVTSVRMPTNAEIGTAVANITQHGYLDRGRVTHNGCVIDERLPKSVYHLSLGHDHFKNRVEAYIREAQEWSDSQATLRDLSTEASTIRSTTLCSSRTPSMDVAACT